MTPRWAAMLAMLAVCGVAAVGLGPARLGAARDYELREESVITRTLRFAAGSPSADRALDIRNLNGSIRVTGTSGDAVDLRARRTIAADTPEGLRRGEREAVLDITGDATTIAAIVREPGAPTCGDDWEGTWQRRPRYQVTYDITVAVPLGTRLRLCTINGGQVDVTGTRGDFEIDNVNGGVSLRDVRGSGSARTVNGRVSAEFLDLPRLDAEFTTVNGDVVVSWPAAFQARLKMKTTNGGLFTDFTVTPIATAPAPGGQRRDGRFVYRSAPFTEAQVGRGGPTITLTTLNGDIRVLRGGR